jgi:hypothetical protein
MGDEELNFTEDEARCWADDPRNQPSRENLVWSAVLILVLFGIALIAVAWLASSGGPESHGPPLSLESASPATPGLAVCVPVYDCELRVAAASGFNRNTRAIGG